MAVVSSLYGLDFHHDADFDNLFSGNMKERTGALGVTAEEDEKAFPPERHARLRCGEGIHAAQEERRSVKIDV